MRIFAVVKGKNMKRICSILMMCLCMASLVAQDMKTVFISMPDSIIPLLTKVNREDCVDFLDSNMKAQVKNRFDNQAELKTLTEDYLQMQITEVSTLEMKLLPLNDSVKVICLVKTLCASACDSEVRFYTTDWQETDASKYLRFPSEEAFYLPKDSVDDAYQTIREKADMYLLRLSLMSDKPALSLEYTTPSYLNKEDREKLMPYLRKEPIVYEWKDGKFQ